MAILLQNNFTTSNLGLRTKGIWHYRFHNHGCVGKCTSHWRKCCGSGWIASCTNMETSPEGSYRCFKQYTRRCAYGSVIHFFVVEKITLEGTKRLLCNEVISGHEGYLETIRNKENCRISSFVIRFFVSKIAGKEVVWNSSQVPFTNTFPNLILFLMFLFMYDTDIA